MINTDDCWLWAGWHNDKDYGRISVFINGKSITRIAHRVVYENLVGEIPQGYVIDHLCQTHRCVNPVHLEAITQQENVRRGKGLTSRENNRITKLTTKEYCSKGHRLTIDNLYLKRRAPYNRILCRTCRRQEAKEYHHRKYFVGKYAR